MDVPSDTGRANGWPDCERHNFLVEAIDRGCHRPKGRQELVNGDQEEGIIVERLAAAGNILLG